MDETETIECKKSTSDKEGILKAVAAFANTHGGIVRIGIDDKGNLTGLHIGAHTVENLARWITEEIRPALYPSIEIRKIGEKEIIEVNVPESSTKPHFYKGVGYLRVGRINKGIEPHELERLMRKKFIAGYDELPADASLDDIDEKKLIGFVSSMRYAGRKKVEYHDMGHTLRALGVYANKRLLNAAVMAFGKDPYAFFPQLSFRCVLRSNGETKDYLFATGTFFEIEKDVGLFLERNLKRTVRIERFERKEYLEIPMEALREAVFNSLIHRDYFHPSGNYLEITESEVIIKNPGKLPEGLEIDALYKRHDSIPQNKIIASLSYLAGQIEQWGEGTLKIVREAVRAGLKQPVFKEEGNFFYVVFKRTSMGEREEKVLSLLSKRKKIGSREAASALKVSERKARDILRGLVFAGLIKKHGKTKAVFYSL